MLRALKQIRRMRGGAQSHLMRCSDNNYFVVKFQNNPRHRRILTGAMRLRLVEEQDEYARIRRLQPAADEDVLRGFRDELEDQFSTYLRNRRAEMAGTPAVGEELRKLIENWNNTLSNGLQLAPQKGVHADDLDAELERLCTEPVAPPRKVIRVGAPGSPAMIRSYCSQVWKAAGPWDRIQKSVRVAEFTFPGDPMRIDYSYRRNGARGYVQTLSVSRAPGDCKLYAYTAARIAARAPFASEFAAVTDVPLRRKMSAIASCATLCVMQGLNPSEWITLRLGCQN